MVWRCCRSSSNLPAVVVPAAMLEHSRCRTAGRFPSLGKRIRELVGRLVGDVEVRTRLQAHTANIDDKVWSFIGWSSTAMRGSKPSSSSVWHRLGANKVGRELSRPTSTNLDGSVGSPHPKIRPRQGLGLAAGCSSERHERARNWQKITGATAEFE